MALKRPHYAYPLRLNAAGTGYELVEQDADEEKEGRVAMTIRCPLDHVDSRPTFGRPDLAHTLADPLDVLDQVIRTQQPAARVLLTERPDAVDRLARTIVQIRTEPARD